MKKNKILALSLSAILGVSSIPTDVHAFENNMIAETENVEEKIETGVSEETEQKVEENSSEEIQLEENTETQEEVQTEEEDKTQENNEDV